VNIARRLRALYSDSSITLIEKEPSCGLHASGRNSGVLHAGRGLSLLRHAGSEFRRLAMDEMMKYSRKRMVSLASQLVEGVRLEYYSKWGTPGIRAQLLDIRKRRLEMDFV